MVTENFTAGITIESLKGSQTSVFGASMSDDYNRLIAKDPEAAPRMAVVGSAASILPNRISWYFDLLGPSVHIDTACSSSMVAVDLAVQSLRNGDAKQVTDIVEAQNPGPLITIFQGSSYWRKSDTWTRRFYPAFKYELSVSRQQML